MKRAKASIQRNLDPVNEEVFENSQSKSKHNSRSRSRSKEKIEEPSLPVIKLLYEDTQIDLAPQNNNFTQEIIPPPLNMPVSIPLTEKQTKTSKKNQLTKSNKARARGKGQQEMIRYKEDLKMWRSAQEIDMLLNYLSGNFDHYQLIREENVPKLESSKLVEMARHCGNMINQKDYQPQFLSGLHLHGNHERLEFTVGLFIANLNETLNDQGMFAVIVVMVSQIPANLVAEESNSIFEQTINLLDQCYTNFQKSKYKDSPFFKEIAYLNDLAKMVMLHWCNWLFYIGLSCDKLEQNTE